MGEKVSSGHARLDAILDGGYRRVSSVLVSGPTGSGKTTMVATFTWAACQRGEKVLYISFDESAAALVDCLLSPGIDLRSALQAGGLLFLTSLPESMGGEEHLVRIYTAIKEFNPHHVVVDSISSCERIGTPQAAFELAMRLVNACKERGITAILTSQTDGTGGEDRKARSIESLADTLIDLRLIEADGELNRTLAVVKARGSRHSNQYREFQITDHGIDIMDVYVGAGAMLTGTARQQQESSEDAKIRLTESEIRLAEQESVSLRAQMASAYAKLKANVEAAEIELERLRLEKRMSQSSRDMRQIMRGAESRSGRLAAEDDEGDEGGAQ